MGSRLALDDFGEPALKVAGFQLWIHGRQFPKSDHCYDGNWLRVTAHCGASGASVWAQGAIVMVTDIAGFGKQCDEMHRGNATCASLDPLEPELCISLQATDGLGHILAQVEITPDDLSQSHRMEFGIDQSYLPNIMKQCSAIVQDYPVR